MTYFSTDGLEGFLNPPPVGDLQGGNGKPEGDGVKAEQPMAKHNRVLRCVIYSYKRYISVRMAVLDLGTKEGNDSDRNWRRGKYRT